MIVDRHRECRAQGLADTELPAQRIGERGGDEVTSACVPGHAARIAPDAGATPAGIAAPGGSLLLGATAVSDCQIEQAPPSHERSTSVGVGPTARMASRPAEAVSAGDELLDGFAIAISHGYAAAVPALRRAISALVQLAQSRRAITACHDVHTLMALGCLAAGILLDDEAEHSLATLWARLARDQRDHVVLSDALDHLGWYETQAGRSAAAARHIGERRQLDTMITCAVPSRGMADLLLVTWRGPEAAARAMAADRARKGGTSMDGSAAAQVQTVLTLLELSLGRYREALSHGLGLIAESLPYLGLLTLPDLVEAAARCGSFDHAASALGRLEQRARASPTARALGLLARSRALLAEDARAEFLYQEAISRLRRTRLVPELARSHLLYGEWLRRQRRRRDAREQLGTACRMFAGIGAVRFVERAQAEVAATGSRNRASCDGPGGALTPQESRVAWLASDGLPNAQIADRLFVSPSTVDYHLRKVFRKLGITSRTQLHLVLPARPEPDQQHGPADT